MSNEQIIKTCSDCGKELDINDFKFITIDDKVLCQCCFDEFMYE